MGNFLFTQFPAEVNVTAVQHARKIHKAVCSAFGFHSKLLQFFNVLPDATGISLEIVFHLHEFVVVRIPRRQLPSRQ